MEHFVVIFVLLVSMVYVGVDYRRLQNESSTRGKIRFYFKMIAFMWFGGILAWIAIPSGNFLLFEPDIKPGTGIHLLMGALMLYFAVTLVVPVWMLASGHHSFREQVKDTFSQKSAIFPVTETERRCFALLSVTVGICEEVIYRYFFVHYFHALPFGFSWLASFALAGVVFALAHFHQGIQGMINALLLGWVFSYVWIMTGTLLTAMILHVLYDLKIVLVSRYTLAKTGQTIWKRGE